MMMSVATQENHLLVFGAGSVGKRHLQNFWKLGCRVSAMDPRPDRIREASQVVEIQRGYDCLGATLSDLPKFSGVIVCSPPKYHVEQAIAALEAGIPVFLEKPISPNATSAEALVRTVDNTGIPLLVGYTYRWWPPLHELRSRLKEDVIGKVLHVKFVMSAHLADWHPWERYQDFFMASKDLGGGALLDESHFIDLLLWLFGSPIDVFAKAERISSLEIETDDNVDAWFSYPDGMRVYLHLDLFGRPHEKFISVTGERGTLLWSFDPNRVRHSSSTDQKWTDTFFSYDRNDMFVNAATEFLEILQGKKSPSCTVNEGYAVLLLIEAMRESSATGRVIRFSESMPNGSAS